MLFVPGNRADLAAKATRPAPDVIVLDLEDAVPPAAKPQARATVQQAATDLGTEVPLCVRVNPPTTSWFADDIAALPEGLLAVVVPKLESAAQLAEVAEALRGRSIVAGLETVRGVADARDVLHAPVIACYFGAEDYVADLGGIRTNGNDEVVYPRSYVAMAARMAGVPALDMVTLDFGHDDRFVGESLQARALGYAGKLCIHPAQVKLANEAFRPSAEEIDWASRLLEAFEQAGGMTIAFEGMMVDEVVAARAMAILGIAEGG
jgi:citrate lyase subunit beta/citryl-CoA lyase